MSKRYFPTFFARPVALLIASVSLMGAAALLTLPRPAWADATVYATNKKELKVGILLLDSTIDANLDGNITPVEAARGPENPDPFVFYIADQRADLKPAGWEFVNPLAPKSVTAKIAARWQARENGNSVYQIGQPVSKNMAAYWEVSLSTTPLSDLVGFDLLFITNHRLSRFNPEEREKLRKLVDAGGIVWIEDCGGMRISPGGTFFLDELQFSGNSFGNPQPRINIPNHPILNTPYPLSFEEIANLGDKNYGNFFMHKIGDVTAPPNPGVLLNIVGNGAANGLPYIAAGNYGAGAVIATSSDSGCDINDYAGGHNVGSGGNSGAYCGPNLDTAHAEDLKFLYNLVAWGSANNTERLNARRTSAALSNLDAPLAPLFDFLQLGTPVDAPVKATTAPLIVQQTIFVSGFDSGGAPTLRAYDAKPYRDADFDSNYDDGLPDLALGAPYDEIWRASLGGASGGVQPSTPTFVTTADNGGSRYQFVCVTLPNGGLAAYQAFPTTPNGRLDLNAQLVWTNPAGSGGTYAGNAAPSPVYVEGRLHVVEPDGRIRCVDALSGLTLWTTFDAPPMNALTPTGSPTAGYVRLQSTAQRVGNLRGNSTGVGNQSSGNTLDLMLYQPVLSAENGGNVARVQPYWLGTRNEVIATPQADGYHTRVADSGPRYWVAPGGGAFINPRARIYANDPGFPGPNLRSARQNYELGIESGAYTAVFSNNGGLDGRIVVTRNGGGTPTPDEVLLSVDYDVLYNPKFGGLTNPPGLNADTAARIENQDALRSAGNADSLTPVALSPDDFLIYGAREDDGSNSPISAIYSTNEQFAPGNTRVRWRFSLHSGVAGAANETTVEDLPPILNVLQFNAADGGDSAASVDPANAEALTAITPVGAPITTNDDITYVLAEAQSSFNGGPVSVLMAFRTDRVTALTLGPIAPGNRPQVAQVDPRTGNPLNLAPTQYSFDERTNRLIITNYMQVQGQGAAASSSQSFAVTYTPNGQTQPITEIYSPLGGVVSRLGNRVGQPFTPLLWYYVLPGKPVSSPSLIGGQIYFSRANLRNGNAAMEIAAVDANAAASDPQVKVAQQAINVVTTLNGATQKINHTRWASVLAGAGNGFVSAPVGSDNILVVNSDVGSFGFDPALTLIADSARVFEAKADGTLTWLLDSTVKKSIVGGELPIYGPQGQVLNAAVATGRYQISRQNLARPALIRSLTRDDLLIADTGNNRVVRVDRGGAVKWELTRFADPYRILASGDPTTLNNPTDIQLYIARTFNPGTNQFEGYEVHYLIADTGNYRVIEVADYFDANGRPMSGPGIGEGQKVLVWTTRTTSLEGRRLRFRTLERIGFGKPSLIAVVGGTTATAGNSGGGSDFTGGSLVALNYNPINTVYLDPAGTPQLSSWVGDQNTAGPNEPAGNGRILEAISQVLSPDGTVKRLLRPTYFKRITLGNLSEAQNLPGAPAADDDYTLPRITNYLICDSDGVYQVVPRLVNSQVVLFIVWSFTQSNYDPLNALRLGGGAAPISFVPSSVERLSSGNYLITNSYAGASANFENGRFVGEVIEVKADKTWSGLSIPSIVPGKNNRYRQQMGSTANAPVTEQPAFALRQ